MDERAGTPGRRRVELVEYQRAAELRAALRVFLGNAEGVARANGLTPQRYLLLLLIKGAADGSETATVTALSERLRLAQSTVTELVQRAEEAGLVVRAESAVDARVAHLRVTEDGERRLADAVVGLRDERRHLAQTLSLLAAADERAERR